MTDGVTSVLDDTRTGMRRALVASDGAVDSLAEEVDPEDGAPLGNFPQAIAHAGLVCAAPTLPEAREGVAA